ncbi:restriction endonuclease subunit S [Curtobacterium sp. VKM Ac-2861]|uniref:restriction endonuclease subunit S n=1 Tax=Curtobacterium sp. VKM Ac-2861 TaxID=2739016 RepID=UPI001566ACFE|nr:restriction endonuclease subunit S [Curtobacterium sp. VKM Ac-2861]
MTELAVHRSLLESAAFVMAPIGSVVAERNEKVSETDFPALSVGKLGVTPQLAGVAKSQTEGDRKLVRAGDLVINSRSDRRGASGLARQDGSVSVVYSVMTPRRDILLPEYGHHLFRSIAFQDEFFRWGTGIVDDLWSTNFTRMSRIRVPLPPIEVQRHVADRMDRTEAMNGRLDQLASLLRARRTATWSTVHALGFDTVRLQWLMDEVDDRAGEENQRLPLLSVSIHHGVLLREHSLSGQQAGADLTKYKVAQTGDIVVNRMRAFQGGLGRAAASGLVSPDYAVLRPRDGVSSSWVEYVMRSPQFIEFMAQWVRGIGGADQGNVRTPRINVRDLLALSIPLPPPAELGQAIAHLDEVTGRIDGMLVKLASLRDLLVERSSAFLLDVVTGKKEVA